jgi:hypothetical protein
MNGERQMVKTSRTHNTQSNVIKVLTPVKPWECKTIYTTFKPVRLAKDLLITNKPVTRAGCDKLITYPDDKVVIGISMVTFFPPWKRKSQLSLSLPFPFLCSIFTLTFPPHSPVGKAQGQLAVGRRQLAIGFALFSFSLCPLWPLWQH